MNKFPVEILEKIFNPLHQTDKVECTRVCWTWKKAIENSVLFKTIRLRSKDQLHKLIATMHGNTTKSNKIEKLIFEIKDVDSAEIDILCYVFFNVRELIFYERVDITDLRFTKILTSHPWSRTIKRITEASSRLFTNCILRGGLCSLLTEITISGQDKSLDDEFIGFLGNAPELRDLTLWKFRLTIANLESLHGKAVWLSSLSLNNVAVCSGGDFFYYSGLYENDVIMDITPAIAMTKLVLDNINISSDYLYVSF
jgi:hypothetical protein